MMRTGPEIPGGNTGAEKGAGSGGNRTYEPTAMRQGLCAQASAPSCAHPADEKMDTSVWHLFLLENPIW